MKLMVVVVAVIGAVVLTACGSDSAEGENGEAATVEQAGGEQAGEQSNDAAGQGGAEGQDGATGQDDAAGGASGEASGDAAGDDPVAVVITHLRGIATGDGDTACAVLSPAGLREFMEQIAEFERNETCEEFIEWIGRFNTDGETVIGGRVVAVDELESVGFEATIDGDRAEVTAPGEPEPAILERIDGTWLIASIPDGEVQ